VDALVLIGVLAVVLLSVLVVVLDRYLAAEAEARASAYLSTPLGQAARVQVHARPFLSQVLRGRYHRVEVTATDLQFGSLRGTTLHAHLTNAYLPVRDLLRRRAVELPVEHVHGDLVIPYRELARASRVPGLRFFYRDERLIVTARLPVPGIGQVAGVSGEAIATIGGEGGVSVRVRNLAVAGFTVPRIVLSQLVPELEFAVPLPPLPYGLRIEQLDPTDQGLRVSGSSHAVVFRANPAS
jgi:hypothetical protein